MFESILNSESGTFSVTSELICLGVALILGILVALTHAAEGRTNKKFLIALAVMPMLVQVVITMVNGNLGTSVAVLGTFSLIRFRSIKSNARELLSIFFVMAIGLSLGMGQVFFAIVFTVVTCLVLLLANRLPFGGQKNYKRLKIVVPEDLDYEKMFDKIFDKYTNSCELIKSKTTNMGSLYELVYEVEMKSGASGRDFMDDIRTKNGNLKVILSTPIAEESV